MTWGWHESGLQANPKGSNDQGGACGIGQVHVASMPDGELEGLTCAELRSDLRKSVRAQMLVMRYFEWKCGSLIAAMTAYSTRGECPTKGKTIPLVVRRMKEAEGK
jgi:hypothetical protein